MMSIDRKISKRLDTNAMDDSPRGNGLKAPLLSSTMLRTRYTDGLGDVPATTGHQSNTIAERLTKRKNYVMRKRLLVEVEFVLCMIGLILVFVETELYNDNMEHKATFLSWILKSIVTISTIGLLGSICMNYHTTINIRILDQKLASWELAVDSAIVSRFILEMVVCSLHPFPGDFFYTDYKTSSGEVKMIHIDAILSVVMMFRLYILAKFAVIHSSLLTDTSTLSIAALSQVKINSRFVFKSVLSTNPAIAITCIMFVILLSLSWSMRTCEIYYEHSSPSNNIFDAMWLVSITFLTVGYGDIIPISYCGRFVSVCSGIIGIATTALLVAVIAKKLEQSRSQKYVFSFVSRMHVERQKKAAAADIVKGVLRIFALRKRGDANKKTLRRERDKINQAVKKMKNAAEEMERISVSSVGLVEISQQVDKIERTVEKMNRDNNVASRMSNFENRLNNIELILMDIRKTVQCK